MNMLSRQLFPGVAGAIFLALTLTGPGRYALDRWLGFEA